MVKIIRNNLSLRDSPKLGKFYMCNICNNIIYQLVKKYFNNKTQIFVVVVLLVLQVPRKLEFITSIFC